MEGRDSQIEREREECAEQPRWLAERDAVPQRDSQYLDRTGLVGCCRDPRDKSAHPWHGMGMQLN